MSNIQALRAEAPRSPEREKLAEAIQTRDQAADRLARISKVAEGNFVCDAMDDLEIKLKALAKARERAPLILVAQLIGDMGSTSETVERAQWELEDAQDKLNAAQSARRALDDQQQAAERELERARIDVGTAISAVIMAEGGANTLLSQFQGAKREVARLYEALSFLSTKNCLPPYWDSVRTAPPSLADEPWRQMFAALETDADVPLPK